MNKKKLSVVMAGAMLASSVAPVLAAETTVTEYSTSQKKLLANEIKALMESKLISTNKTLYLDTLADGGASTTKSGEFVSQDVANIMLNAASTSTNNGTDGKGAASAYGVAIVDTNGKEGTVVYNVEKAISNIEGMTVGQTLKVYERKTNAFADEIIPGTAITVADGTIEKYKTADFTSNGTDVETSFEEEAKLKAAQSTAQSKLVKSITVNNDGDGVVITLNALNENNSNKTIELKNGDEKLNFYLAYDKDGNLIDTTDVSQIQNFDHFGKKVTKYTVSSTTTEKTLNSTYKIVADKTEDETLNATDLYDGFALTSKGTEILADLKNAADKAEVTIATPGNAADTTGALVQLKAVGSIDSSTGYYSFDVEYYKVTGSNTATKYKTVTVRSTNKKELDSLHALLQTGTFNVGIVAGDNRYETAVNVAKSAGTALGTTASASATKNIVIVNGESLVDGLAAAPYAADVNGASNQAAPILLSKSDSLPTATKEYLKELASSLPVKSLDDITVTLIGGKTVLTDSLVSELEDIGFTVKRIGGDNREETSVKVAEKIGTSASTFVVGGEGEADAMSVSAVAATNKTPIIVAKKGGISSDALSYLEDNASTGAVRIIGGENVFSTADEEKVNEVLGKNNAAYRIAGSNRQATNAAVIKEYYNSSAIQNSTGVVLVKDGQSNKSELIDALSAANYAAKLNAPIVLGTSKVTDAQKTSLLNVHGTVAKVAQVGEGANRTLLETIAGLFNVSNK